MARHGLSQEQFQLIAHLFAPPARTGRPPKCPKRMFDGILWILHTGAPWRDLPVEFGPWSTVWEWFDRWNHDGTLINILSALQASHIQAGQIDPELWCIDGTIIRAARCCAGGAKKTTRKSLATTP